MRSFIVVILTAATCVTASASQATRPTAPCTFNVPSTRPAAEIVGPPDITARTRVMTQPDSPVAIVRLDLTAMKLTTSPGWNETSGSYTVDIRNISTETLTDAIVWLHVTDGVASGGHGRRARRSLGPGDQVRLEVKMGAGRGSSNSTREATAFAFVEWVTTAACKFKPSQVLMHDPTIP